MEDEESDIHNFINVHSFSQLPFTRPPLSTHKSPPILRLFGQDFTRAGDNGDNSGADIQEQEEEEEEEDNSDNKSSNNNRRFECHFCFRNFPTSQALGGHQNAHKRERQLAKRGVSSYLHHSDNYRRYYTPWNSGALPATARFYGANVSGSGMSTNTINGNPLGVWRVPSSSTSASASATASTSVYNSAGAFSTHRNSSSSSNLTATQQPPRQLVGGSAAQNQTSSYWYGLKPNVQDNVSLDLHL